MFGRKLLAVASIFSIIHVASVAMAKVELNAMCFMNQNESTVHEFNPTKSEIADDNILKKNPFTVTKEEVATKFRIASLSKILTTHWAVTQLGPEYRFKTKIYVSPGTKAKYCNVHIEGDMDPYMGREMLGRIFSQLKPKLSSQSCKYIETLSYDEHFPVYLEVMKHQVTHDIGWDNPLTFFNSAKTKNDLTSFVKNKSGLSGNFNNIGLVMKERYDAYLKTVPYKVYSVKSRPLYMMVKDMNKFSYNYPPEVLFAKLGGLTAYSSFIAQRLKLVTSDVEMYNGSGYPIMVNGDKKYNQVSCASIVMVLKDLDLFLTTYKGSRSFEMADVMAVGGPGESYSTFKGLYGGGTYNNTLTAKTGSADRAITFGGMLSTKDGDLYFAVLTSPDNYSNPDVSNARILIRSLVQTLVERNQLKKFSYKQIGNMKAFDEQSALVEEKVATKIATSLK